MHLMSQFVSKSVKTADFRSNAKIARSESVNDGNVGQNISRSGFVPAARYALVGSKVWFECAVRPFSVTYELLRLLHPDQNPFI
jgi:hypothetical protein